MFWSGVSEMKYPIPMRVLLFEELYECQDRENTRAAITTYASSLRAQFSSAIPATIAAQGPPREEEGQPATEGPDPYRSAQKRAIEFLGRDENFNRGLEGNGVPYGLIVGILKGALPDTMNDRDTIAFRLVPTALNELLGPQNQGWDTEMREAKDGRRIRFVIRLPRKEQLSFQ